MRRLHRSLACSLLALGLGCTANSNAAGTGWGVDLADEEDSEGEVMTGTEGGDSAPAGEDGSGAGDDDGGDGEVPSDDSATSGGGTDDGDPAGTDGGSEGDEGGAVECPADVFEMLWSEDAMLQSPMTYGVAESAVGSPMIALSEVAEEGTISFEVDIPCGGDYRIFGLVWDIYPGAWSQDDADSFHVSLGGGDEFRWSYGCQTDGQENALSWQSLHSAEDDDCTISPVSVEFPEPGTYVIRLRNLEAGSGSAVAGIAGLAVSSDWDADPHGLYSPYGH
ncbi:MAG: hypothetical protein AAF799_15755 [Myxococcota bacterium]